MRSTILLLNLVRVIELLEEEEGEGNICIFVLKGTFRFIKGYLCLKCRCKENLGISKENLSICIYNFLKNNSLLTNTYTHPLVTSTKPEFNKSNYNKIVRNLISTQPRCEFSIWNLHVHTPIGHLNKTIILINQITTKLSKNLISTQYRYEFLIWNMHGILEKKIDFTIHLDTFGRTYARIKEPKILIQGQRWWDSSWTTAFTLQQRARITTVAEAQRIRPQIFLDWFTQFPYADFFFPREFQYYNKLAWNSRAVCSYSNQIWLSIKCWYMWADEGPQWLWWGASGQPWSQHVVKGPHVPPSR